MGPGQPRPCPLMPRQSISPRPARAHGRSFSLGPPSQSVLPCRRRPKRSMLSRAVKPRSKPAFVSGCRGCGVCDDPNGSQQCRPRGSGGRPPKGHSPIGAQARGMRSEHSGSGALPRSAPRVREVTDGLEDTNSRSSSRLSRAGDDRPGGGARGIERLGILVALVRRFVPVRSTVKDGMPKLARVAGSDFRAGGLAAHNPASAP